MAENIVRQDIASLLDGWIEAERNGVEFPVPFDLAWGVAGYGRKSTAKRDGLKGLKEGKHLCTQKCKTPHGGRPSELINLSLDGFKHLCMMSITDEGEQIRDYFINAEKKWKLVQQIAPAVAQEVELMSMKLEIAKLEAQKAAAEQQTISLRHLIVATMPEPMQQKILGFSVIEKIEYRDRIIKDNSIINDGSTINKTRLCQRYGILTKAGKPDYKRLNYELATAQLPETAWEETDVVQTNRELRREYLDVLDRSLYTAEQRQMWVGEN